MTACDNGRPAGGVVCFGGAGGVVVVTLGRQAAMRVVASASVQTLTAVVWLHLTVIDSPVLELQSRESWHFSSRSPQWRAGLPFRHKLGAWAAPVGAAGLADPP